MDRDKFFFRGVLLFLFDMKKNAAEAHRMLSDTYGEDAPTERTCENWFSRFKSGNFDLKDKERSGAPKKFEITKLQALIDENPCITQNELALQLDVNRGTISRNLLKLRKIRNDRKWVPYH